MLQMDRNEIVKRMCAQINVSGHIVGAAVGSGMTAKCAIMGGADILLGLSAGKFRLMGRGSYASYLCNCRSNDIVMDLGTRELFPIISDVPILFGLFASDPDIHIYDYLKQIKAAGFSGIVNFPTLSLIDGKFKEALEEEGTSYEAEVEAVRLAKILDLFTIAFVTTEHECKKMLNAGADMICAHLGLTKGGLIGAGNYLSLKEAQRLTQGIFKICKEERPDVIRVIYAGPASTPMDLQYMYQNTDCQGYIGGSTFDRIPAEHAIINTVKAFKTESDLSGTDPMARILNGTINAEGYVDFVKKYISEHYFHQILLSELALVAHVSPSYLSVRFKNDTGMSFTEYLIQFRINMAKELLHSSLTCKQVALQIGYDDYAQFSKIFKKYTGFSPMEFKVSESKGNVN
jgi:predicted TIM-barrel enzyme/AraC-like DNA-binding protein